MRLDEGIMFYRRIVDSIFRNIVTIVLMRNARNRCPYYFVSFFLNIFEIL